MVFFRKTKQPETNYKPDEVKQKLPFLGGKGEDGRECLLREKLSLTASSESENSVAEGGGELLRNLRNSGGRTRTEPTMEIGRERNSQEEERRAGGLLGGGGGVGLQGIIYTRRVR
jgi:hypothetical protein